MRSGSGFCCVRAREARLVVPLRRLVDFAVVARFFDVPDFFDAVDELPFLAGAAGFLDALFLAGAVFFCSAAPVVEGSQAANNNAIMAVSQRIDFTIASLSKPR